MQLFVIRHAETVANSEKRYLGHTDSPLTTLGRQQAEELAEVFLGRLPDVVFVSDLPRTMATAQPLVWRTGVPVKVDARLRELDFGHIDGMTYKSAMEAYNKNMQEWYDDYERKAPPGGETLAAMRDRVFDFVAELLEQPYKTVAVFTHGGVFNLLLAHATSQSFVSAWSNPGELMEMELSGEKESWTLRKTRQP